MNILYLTGYRYPSGLDEPITSGDLRYSFTLSRALVRNGHKVTVVTRKSGSDEAENQLDDVKILRYKSEFGKVFSTSFDISLRRMKLFKRALVDADLVICNSPLTLEHLIKINKPIIYIASGLEDIKNYELSIKEVVSYMAIKLLRDPMKKLTWKKSVRVNTTASSEDTTLAGWGIPETKIGTISSSVDTTHFYQQKAQSEKLRDILGYDKSDNIILSVSRFTPAKGILETIMAFNKLSIANKKLLIVGVHHSHNNGYYDKVIESISQSKHTNDIKILENVPEAELPIYYSLADVTSVFSIGYDPLPTVIIESMACGTPVVSTYYKTREQFIIDGKNGIFVGEADTIGWAERVSEVLIDRALHERLSNNGLATVKKNFNANDIAEKIIGIVEHE